MKFNIPTPRIPSNGEMKVIAEKWWQHHIGINFFDWNDILRSSSFPYRIIKLNIELINETLELYDKNANLDNIISKYVELLNPALIEMDCKNSFFIKLISRSPKDFISDTDNHGKPEALTSVADAIRAILGSMRCLEDLVLLKHLDTAAIVIRPYLDFHPSNEWRVYIKDKEIIGISQYYYDSEFPELTKKAVAHINLLIRLFIINTVIPNMKLADYVADVVFYNYPRETILLETNPYGLSDPCLFENYDSFDQSIIWKREGTIHKIKTT